MQPKLYPIFFHGNPGEGMDRRFDTTMIPNGSVAVLQHIARMCGYEGMAVDEGYLGQNNTAESVLTHLIESALAQDKQPIILASVLSYNAETTLSLLKQLKEMYNKKIRVGIGGQLIRVCPAAYTRLSYLDHIGVGDAEIILPRFLRGERFVCGHIENNGVNQYTDPEYKNYWALVERLNEMATYHLGPFTNIRQLVVESVRGCAWAYATETCDMCSLEGVDLQPLFKNLPASFNLEKKLQEKGATWSFDVSNQWLPMVRHDEMVEWLKTYNTEKNKHLGNTGGLNKYVYLTANSITPQTAPLLQAAGIRIAYIGFDGWDKRTLLALHKAQPSMQKVLKLCRENDIHVRTSLVIGNGVTKKNISELPDFVRDMISQFGDVIRSWGNFIQIVLPGSPVFSLFKKLASENGWQEVNNLYNEFEKNGYLSWSEQSRLNEFFIRRTQSVDYEKLVAARDAVELIVAESRYTTGVTIEHGGQLK